MAAASGRERAESFLSTFAHRCPGCRRDFRGQEAFLQFLRHLDLDLACRYAYEEYLDAVRADAGGA